MDTLTGTSVTNSRMTGDYKVRTYEATNPGIYPYIYWHHASCIATLNDKGETAYVCHAWYEYALLP